MNPCDQRQGAPDFVALQMANEVPAHACNSGGLAPQFLGPTLAKVLHAQLPQQGGDFDGHRLGDGDQRDFAPRTPRALAGGLQALLYGSQISGDPLSALDHTPRPRFYLLLIIYSL